MAHNFLYITIILYVPLTPLPEGRGAVGGPDDEDALAVKAGVSVDDDDGDVHVTAADVSVDAVTVDAVTAADVTAAVSVDAGTDALLAVVVDADADVDADVVTIVVTVDTMLHLVILAIE